MVALASVIFADDLKSDVPETVRFVLPDCVIGPPVEFTYRLVAEINPRSVELPLRMLIAFPVALISPIKLFVDAECKLIDPAVAVRLT